MQSIITLSTNETVVAKLSGLREKLQETRGVQNLKRGYEKAALLNGVENGRSGWLLHLKEWLKDPAYIFWLGRCGGPELKDLFTRAYLPRV
jgi:hypothetical protein